MVENRYSPPAIGAGRAVKENRIRHVLLIFAAPVSGGCIEGEVVRRTREVIETGEPVLLEFGIANEDAWSVGLSCGGRIEIFVEPVE